MSLFVYRNSFYIEAIQMAFTAKIWLSYTLQYQSFIMELYHNQITFGVLGVVKHGCTHQRLYKLMSEGLAKTVQNIYGLIKACTNCLSQWKWSRMFYNISTYAILSHSIWMYSIVSCWSKMQYVTIINKWYSHTCKRRHIYANNSICSWEYEATWYFLQIWLI